MAAIGVPWPEPVPGHGPNSPHPFVRLLSYRQFQAGQQLVRDRYGSAGCPSARVIRRDLRHRGRRAAALRPPAEALASRQSYHFARTYAFAFALSGRDHSDLTGLKNGGFGDICPMASVASHSGKLATDSVLLVQLRDDSVGICTAGGSLAGSARWRALSKAGRSRPPLHRLSE